MSGRQRIASRQSPLLTVFEALTNAFAWPEDADVVPDWRLAQEARAAEIEILELPHYRTRAEFDAQVALCEAALADPPTETLAHDAAAARFMAWLLAHGATGTHTSDQLRALYATHCQQEALTPVPEAQLRKFLGNGNYPGVHKHKDKSKKHGNRHRPTMWTITDLQPTSVAA